MTFAIASHEWRGQSVGIRLIPGHDSLTLEISLLHGDGQTSCDLNKRCIHKLSRAADIVLEFSATLARLVWQGKSAKIQVKPPRPKLPVRPQTADEAITLRPQIEELIAPLLFELVPQPSLRPFQEFGVRWLVEHRVGILADDMGLGKTAQALRALRILVNQGKISTALVVCPKSLLANWEIECALWAPELTVVRCVPPKNKSNEVWLAVHNRSHIIITSYEQLRPLPKPLASAKFDLVIADEAHKLRRSQAKLVKAFKLMNAKRIWALTGTPIERHEEDLATLLSLLEPTRFSVKSVAIESSGLRADARPYMLRRLKKDVLASCPT